ncbi:MAG: hypothetical protein AAF773_09615 [Cyanobacteria bacterium P01_D01_bin.115]
MGIGADSWGRWQCAMCGQTTPGCIDASMLSPGRFFGGGLKESSHLSDPPVIAHSS